MQSPFNFWKIFLHPNRITIVSFYQSNYTNLCEGFYFLLFTFVDIFVNIKQLMTYQFIFNEVAHNLVVEVLNGSPLDALLDILFLRVTGYNNEER